VSSFLLHSLLRSCRFFSFLVLFCLLFLLLFLDALSCLSVYDPFIFLTVASISFLDGCTQTLVSGGVIEPIAELLDSENEDHQRFASLALANMATDITAIPLLMHTQSLKV